MAGDTIVKHTIIAHKLRPDGHVNISAEVEKAVEESSVINGLCNIFAKGSTAALILTEDEVGHIKDLFRALELLAPSNAEYEHHKAWHDDNGKSHVRAAFLQQSITIPIVDGELDKGTWQHIMLFNLDTRERVREVVITVMGQEA